MPQIVIEQPGVPPRTGPVPMGEMRFGRSDESDVVLTADEVSRNHARIVRSKERTLLHDMNSLNGTYVNRQRVVERMLTHMDEIWFGSKCRLVYRDDTRFGRDESDLAEESATEPNGDPTSSDIQVSLDSVRAEMDQVGQTMTLLGRRSPATGTSTAAATVSEAPADVVKMGRAYRRMAALYKASQVMAANFDLDTRLSEVLDLVLEMLQGERGFVLLKEEQSRSLRVRVARSMGQDLAASSPSMGIAGRAALDGEPVLVGSVQENQELAGRESVIRQKITGAMCVPLRVKDRVIGSIYVDTRNPAVVFDTEDFELFSALASQSAMAIDNVVLHDQVVSAEKRRQDFGRFLAPQLVEMIIQEDREIELGGQYASVTTLFCDIRGFTPIAERLDAASLVDLLNEHFTAMTEIIFAFQGTLNKYIGDEFMAVFGAPFATGEDERRAVAAAVAIQERNSELNAIRRAEGREVLNLGIGIDTGEVIAGYMGSPMRLEFTVVGDRVNTASRFCSLAQTGQIIVGEATWAAIESIAEGRPIGTVVLKGKEKPVHAFEVTRVAAPAESAPEAT